VLGGKALTCREPVVLLSDVANSTPLSVRGDVYRLYLVKRQRYWNAQPTYVLDEFSAYINGSKARKAEKIPGRQETVQYMQEFIVYSLVMLYAAEESDPVIIGAVQALVEEAVKVGGIRGPPLIALRTSQDCRKLREYTRKVFTPHWTATWLGF